MPLEIKAKKSSKKLEVRLLEISHLEPFLTARHGSKDVIGVHGAEDERRAVPLGAARAAAQRARPTLQTRHAHGAQILMPPLHRHLCAAETATSQQRPTSVEALLHWSTGKRHLARSSAVNMEIGNRGTSRFSGTIGYLIESFRIC